MTSNMYDELGNIKATKTTRRLYLYKQNEVKNMRGIVQFECE
ncbi:hypothetical protein ABH892_000349 [Paenibacillus sp. RC254]